MNIQVDPAVLEHMSKKGKTVLTLTVQQSGGGCCPTIESADVELKEPKNTDLYTTYEQDGIRIFVGKNVRVTAPVLRFTLEKIMFVKSIVPRGIQLKGH